MAAYIVGTSYSGRVWRESWQQIHLEDERPATAEESALMNKVIWNNDTAEDRAKLRALLQKR